MEKATPGEERIISMVDMFGSVQPLTDLCMYVCMYESQGEVNMSSRVMVMMVVVMVRARIESEDFQVTVVGIGMIG